MNAAAAELFAKRDKWREILAVKEAAKTEANRWWLRASLPLRGYLLAQSGAEHASKFIDVPWQSLPDGLRTSIYLNVKATQRELMGSGWL